MRKNGHSLHSNMGYVFTIIEVDGRTANLQEDRRISTRDELIIIYGTFWRKNGLTHVYSGHIGTGDVSYV
jgi:hypothetical protein